MENNLEYYLGLPYTRELIPEPSGIWFVRIKELPYCMSQGNSPEEALRNINDAMRGWIKTELEDGEIIPEPRAEDGYSGKFNMRVTKRLHRLLAEAADRDGMSMNAYICALLAEAVGANSARPAHETPQNSFSTALRAICQASGVEHMDGKDPEVEFTTWLKVEIDRIENYFQTGDRSKAFENLTYVARLLRPHSKDSPTLLCMADLLDWMKQTMQRPVENVRIQSQPVYVEIGKAINEVNRNVSKGREPISIHKKYNQAILPASPVDDQANKDRFGPNRGRN